MYRIIKFIFLLVFALPVLAEEINTTYFDGLAVDGYDVVAYFMQGKPVKGKPEFQYEWQNAKWRFSSRENLKLFQKFPVKYAPQYGGYCAYAMSDGDKVDISPDAWSIVNGKLYLNYDKGIQKKWESRKNEYIIQADKKWKIIGKK